uniref:Ribosomal RNA-processing protein 42 n=1 Tax=Ditylenchus dipsaci TaxID=166011 RepID=A0A915CRW3_9BILA
MLIEFMAQEARILNVTSSYYERCLHVPSIEILTGKEKSAEIAPNDFYSISKLANCMHVVALNDRLSKLGHPGIKTVAVRPGFVRGTDLGRHTNVILRWLAAPLIWMVAKNLEEGTSTMLHCSTCKYEELASGKLYYENKLLSSKKLFKMDTCLSVQEKSFIIDGIQHGIRNDGRGLSDYRPIFLETVCCRRRMDLQEFKSILLMSLSGKCHSKVCRQGGHEMGEELAKVLHSAYDNEVVLPDIKKLVLAPTFIWTVNVDVVILQYGGNVLDAISLGVKAALGDTLICEVLIRPADEGR